MSNTTDSCGSAPNILASTANYQLALEFLRDKLTCAGYSKVGPRCPAVGASSQVDSGNSSCEDAGLRDARTVRPRRQRRGRHATCSYTIRVAQAVTRAVGVRQPTQAARHSSRTRTSRVAALRTRKIAPGAAERFSNLKLGAS
eukprot:2456790-Pleurochrysis_carterae.AAC.8